MTRADIELMLANLAETTRYLQETGRIVRQAAEKIAAVADHLDPVSDLASLPVILTITEVAAIYRISLGTLRRGLQTGTFSPPPFDRYPYRWRRDDVAADLRRPRAPRARSPHGFARARPKEEGLRQDHEGRMKLDVVGTTGGKATVATAVPKRPKKEPKLDGDR